MNLLTQRTLRIFAVLEDYRGGSKDVLDSVMPFFEPILAEINGEILDPPSFAERVKKAYRWNFTADIVEELLPRFEAKGWVKVTAKTQDKITCRVTCSNPAAAMPGEAEIRVSQRLSNVVGQFREFIKDISPLSQFSRTDEELSDMLVEWLVSIDAYTEDVLRDEAIHTVKTEGRISLAVSLPDASRLTNEERYLCARFVRRLFDEKSPFITDLCKIASVGLLTEVIQDFQKPVTHVNKTNLTVYLDAPVALDLLGVSGAAAAANIRPIMAKLQEIGASIRIFRVSVEELTRALDAVLKRSIPERTGPTADALRRHETAEAFVRQVANDPDTALSLYGIQVVDRKLNQYPGEHDYFPKEMYDQIFSKMRWHLDLHRREHDATVIAQIMRMRAGTASRDIFQTRHLLITKNAPLAQLARRFCVDADLLTRNSIGPAIHQRQIATAIWLRTGLSGTEDIPRRYVLAACERVLELKKNVVDQVRILARNLTPASAEQIDALLTQDRSVQVLMDKTLGVSQVVTAATFDELIEDMKVELVVDIEREKSEEVKGIKREASEKVRDANSRRRAAELTATQTAAELRAVAEEDRHTIQSLVDEINRHIKGRRVAINWLFGLLIFGIGALPWMSDSLSGKRKVVSLIIAGLIGAVLSTFQLLDRPIGVGPRLESWGRSRLATLATARGLEKKLARVDVFNVDGGLKLAPPTLVVGGALFVDNQSETDQSSSGSH